MVAHYHNSAILFINTILVQLDFIEATGLYLSNLKVVIYIYIYGGFVHAPKQD